jgi:hypothetical protein
MALERKRRDAIIGTCFMPCDGLKNSSRSGHSEKTAPALCRGALEEAAPNGKLKSIVGEMCVVSSALRFSPSATATASAQTLVHPSNLLARA